MERIVNAGLKGLVCLLALSLMSSCVSSTKGPKFTQVREPEAGRSNVYIYRPFNAMGSSDSPAVLHNGEKILNLLPIRTFFKYSVKPGTHTFETSRALVRAIPVTIDIQSPGQTRYIRVEYKAGIPYAFKMVEVSETRALSELPDCYRTGVEKGAADSEETLQEPDAQQSSSNHEKKTTADAAGSSEKPDRKAELYVETVPEDALVRIMTIKPKFFQGIELDKGPYLIEVSAKGYVTREEWISLDRGEVRRMRVELKPASGEQLPDESSARTGKDQGAADSEVSSGPEEEKSSDTAFPGDKDSEAAEIARLMQQDDSADKHRGVKLALRKYPEKQELLSVAGRVLKEEYNSNQQDRLHVDTMAWMCKYLGYSGKPDFKPLLQEVAERCSNSKIRKYAAKNAEKL